MNFHRCPDNNKTYIWWKFLCFTAAFNSVIWLLVFCIYDAKNSIFFVHSVLSGIYVLVCAFRSFFPRIDLERYCLHDTALSSIALGRSCATIAEICFSIQCALLIYNLAVTLDSNLMKFAAYSLVPIIIIAQLFCWRATLTLNHFWHSMEEYAWVLMLVILCACFITGFFLLTAYQVLMILGLTACLGSIWLMLFVDIPMYMDRARDTQNHLKIKDGLQDAFRRRVHTNDWAIWKKEALWLTSYFTFGVWLSISMVVIRFEA